MVENTFSDTKRAIAFGMIAILMIGFGWRFVETAQGGRPIVAAPVVPPQSVSASGVVFADADPLLPTTLGWLGGCYPPALAVGVYLAGDAPCHPGQTISLAQLEMGLTTSGVLKAEESLEYAPQPARALTCWGLIENGTQAAGWICSDASGVCRTAMDGQGPSQRWQMMTDGSFISPTFSSPLDRAMIPASYQ